MSDEPNLFCFYFVESLTCENLIFNFSYDIVSFNLLFIHFGYSHNLRYILVKDHICFLLAYCP
ncbi:unknown [Prevotella sp. CAG:1185]|nr:unknown [Prevotella sp. CAG:1185]